MDINTLKMIINTLNTTQYMTKTRSDKFMKANNIENGTSIINEVMREFDEDKFDIIKNLQEYEYEKNYRYLTIYKYDNKEVLQKIKDIEQETFNFEELDSINTFFNKPSIKHFQKEVDIKFSLKLKNNDTDTYIKYIVICTLFLDENIMTIKYHSVSEGFYKDEYYIKINKAAKEWIETNLELNLVEFESMKVYKDIYRNLKAQNEEYQNVSIHSISMDDELNGRTYFRATDNEMLPIIGSITELTKSFESEHDKKIILEYIEKYEEEAIIRNIDIKWRNKFTNNAGKQLGSITVGISSAYSVNNEDNVLKFEFMMHHVKQDESINRERINYVVKYISGYFN